MLMEKDFNSTTIALDSSEDERHFLIDETFGEEKNDVVASPPDNVVQPLPRSSIRTEPIALDGSEDVILIDATFDESIRKIGGIAPRQVIEESVEFSSSICLSNTSSQMGRKKSVKDSDSDSECDVEWKEGTRSRHSAGGSCSNLDSPHLSQEKNDVVASPPDNLVQPLARSSIRAEPTLTERDFNSAIALDSSEDDSDALINGSCDEARRKKYIKNSDSDIVFKEDTVSHHSAGDSGSSHDSASDSEGTASDDSVEFGESKPRTNLFAPPQILKKSEAPSSTTSKSDTSSQSTKPEDSSSASSSSSSLSLQNTASSLTESHSELRQLKEQLETKTAAYNSLMHALKTCHVKNLKDGGQLLREKVERCRLELEELKKRHRDCLAGNGDIEFVGAVKKDIIFSTKDQKIAHLGEKGLETHRVEKALTMDALASLHSSLASMPAADTLADPPADLTVPLMLHQRQALSWLLYREGQTPAGGILADDMGLGKTLTMIALVMKSEERKSGNEENEKPRGVLGSSNPAHAGKTLVVCPASLIEQWMEEVRRRVRRGRLVTLLHHGPDREGRGRKLAEADIVVTTYGVLKEEYKNKAALFRVAWQRVILDEAHQIRNPKTQWAVAACELAAKYRWCLTGTPIHNKAYDVYSLLKFLRCSPFDDQAVWKRWVDNKTPAGQERLNTVVKSILLRRTKEELKTGGELFDLPSKELHHIHVELDQEELEVYESVMKFSKTLVAQYLTQRMEKEQMQGSRGGGLMAGSIERLQSQLRSAPDIKTHEILVLLLRLRQICCLPGLVSAMLEEGAAAADGFAKEDSLVEDLSKQVRRLTIGTASPEQRESTPRNDLEKVLLTSNPVFDITRPSSKIRTVLETLRKVVERGEKVVVVSQWAVFLRHLRDHLKALGIKSAIFDGSVAVKDRGGIIENFNDPHNHLRVLLLSLTAGGVGLNLVGGSHLILMEPHWNPQLEAQASDRIYRVGQTKPVSIYKVICKDTIEERIELLQEKKLILAKNVLSGQLKKEATKLSFQDLQSLFGL